MKNQTLYINVDATNPQTALVRSTTNTQPYSLGSIVAGDTVRYTLVAVDGTGATSSLSGNTNIMVRAALGGLGDGPIVYSTDFRATGSAWTGSLNTATQSLYNQLGTSDTINTFFEVVFIASGSLFDSGSHYTVLQTPVTVRNQVITN
jgi:hypothetical protein